MLAEATAARGTPPLDERDYSADRRPVQTIF